jgi:hypothetical protein
MNINNKSKDMKNKTLFHIDEAMNYANISELELQLSDNKRTVLLLRESLITLYNEMIMKLNQLILYIKLKYNTFLLALNMCESNIIRKVKIGVVKYIFH